MQCGALHKALSRGQIKVCLVEVRGEIAFSYEKNKKVTAALHPIHSCSKSVTSMLVGICLREGLIPSIDTPIGEYFGEHLANERNSNKAGITIFHLLTMSSGIDWPEFGEWNYWSPMEFSRDIVKSALEREIAAAPGAAMNYNSGSTNLLSAIIQRASGMKTVDFAHKHLFAPLGIEDVHWHEKQGISLGANGLKMRPADMLKLGRLCLHRGAYGGAQIVPEAWMLDSTRPLFVTYPHIGAYGYSWWVSDFTDAENREVAFYFAMGLFGQFVIVVPERAMVAVFLSENYSDTLKPLALFRQHIATARWD